MIDKRIEMSVIESKERTTSDLHIDWSSLVVEKRHGEVVAFDVDKIRIAVTKAFSAMSKRLSSAACATRRGDGRMNDGTPVSHTIPCQSSNAKVQAPSA